MPSTPDPQRDALAAESIAYQFVIEVMRGYISPAEFNEIVPRLSAEFSEYVHHAMGAGNEPLATRMVALGKEPLHRLTSEMQHFSDLRPWRLL